MAKHIVQWVTAGVIIVAVLGYFALQKVTIVIPNEIMVKASVEDVFEYMTRQQGHKPNYKSVKVQSETEDENGTVTRVKEIVEAIPIIAGFSRDISYTATSVITKPVKMESFVEMGVLSLHHVFHFQKEKNDLVRVIDRNEITLARIIAEFTRRNADKSHKQILEAMKRELESGK